MQAARMPAATHFSHGHKLSARDNPRSSRDYVISIQKRTCVPLSGFDQPQPVKIFLRYVPDRLICDVKHMDAYFVKLAEQPYDGMEELANTIADDFNDELIPRWISVEISVDINDAVLKAHVEDKQPLWENTALLGRLV